MLAALSAASSALDALQALSSSKPKPTGLAPDASRLFETSGSGAASAGPPIAAPVGGAPPSGPLAPGTMSAMLDAQSRPAGSASSPSDAMKQLFSMLDGDGNGQISKSEFEDKLGAGGSNVANADKVFSKLDTDGDGSVSLDELSAALKGGKGHHHAPKVASSSGSGSDPLLQALQGASSTTTTNSDGTTTTSMTYADGSTVSMTSAPTGTASSSAASSYNVIEQMIQRQAQASSGGSAVSVSA